jgi:hypothetical protein
MEPNSIPPLIISELFGPQLMRKKGIIEGEILFEKVPIEFVQQA